MPRIFKIHTQVCDTRKTYVEKFSSEDGMRNDYESSTVGSLTREHIVEEINIEKLFDEYYKEVYHLEGEMERLRTAFPNFQINWKMDFRHMRISEFKPEILSEARYDFEVGDEEISRPIYVAVHKYDYSDAPSKNIIEGVASNIIISDKASYSKGSCYSVVCAATDADEKLAVDLVESRLSEEGEVVNDAY